MSAVIYTICTHEITETTVIAIVAVIGLFVGSIEIRKSIQISHCLAETSIIVDFNKWTSEYNKSQTFNHAARVLNVSETMAKSVKRGIYPYEAYKSSLLPVTFQYFYRLELAYYNEKMGDTEAFRELCEHFAKVLLPVFEIYNSRVENKLKTVDRTCYLERFDPSEIDLTKSESKTLKYEIKYPRLHKYLLRIHAFF